MNNEFMKYISNPQIRLIAGMNLALVITAMSISEMKIMLLRLRKNFWV